MGNGQNSPHGSLVPSLFRVVRHLQSRCAFTNVRVRARTHIARTHGYWYVYITQAEYYRNSDVVDVSKLSWLRCNRVLLCTEISRSTIYLCNRRLLPLHKLPAPMMPKTAAKILSMLVPIELPMQEEVRQLYSLPLPTLTVTVASKYSLLLLVTALTQVGITTQKGQIVSNFSTGNGPEPVQGPLTLLILFARCVSGLVLSSTGMYCSPQPLQDKRSSRRWQCVTRPL